jgi:hypothetical protein
MLGILLSGCMGDVDQYKNDKPELDLKTYLNGNIKGHGIIENWKGNVVSKFDFYGTWDGDEDTFDETMIYYNGKKDHRVWHLTKISDNHYIGRNKDAIGQAEIRIAGNAMHWQYKMNVEVSGSTYKLAFDDWMFLMHDGGLININYFKKFGLTVGKLTLYMQKQD